MKKIGFLMVAAGFLVAALATVLHGEAVAWNPFVRAIVVGVAGVVVVRMAARRESTTEGKLAANIEMAEHALGSIVENITRLNEEKAGIDPYDVRHKVDELFVEDVARFVGTRQSIGHLYGLSAYGEVMSSFAAGERYLNRVWSASADGYVDEVNAYLEKARQQFTDSLEKFRALKVGAAQKTV